MEVRNSEDIEAYLASSGQWLRRYGLQKLADHALVEDVMQELAVWALTRVSRGRTFNSHYLGLRFRSLLRDARREWTRSCPPVGDESASPSIERRLDARRALARLAALPDGDIMVDRADLGVHEAAARHGLSVGALNVRVHRFRKRHAASLASDIAA